MTVMNNEDPADPSVHEPVRAETWMRKLAEVPIVSRGMGWQANATATLREGADEIERLRAELNCWRNNGRGLRLSDPEMAETLARLKHRLATDKEFAHSVLYGAGIVRKDGKLTKLYRA